MQTLSISTVLTCCASAWGGWTQLAPIPDKLGVAAPFAGVSGHALLVAGGANFPDKPPWDGGRKAWHDTVYALDRKDGAWKIAGHLPRPLAYGVSASFAGRMICVGGSDSDRCYADSFWLDWSDGKLTTVALPPLPSPLANACGTCVGAMLYVACGQTSSDATEATNKVYRLDLSATKPAWESIAPLPGPGRILAAAASLNDGFYVIGGAALSPGADHQPRRQYLSEAWCFKQDTGWKRIKDLPTPIVAAPSPAPTDGNGIFILGGDDGSHTDFKPIDLHPGFSKTILHFDQRTNAWTDAGDMPAPRVTVPCIQWDDGWAITSGEMRPGVRSPQLWMFSTKETR